MKALVVDLFAGGGGASIGIEAALGGPVDIAINHSATAIAVHAANHPETRHFTTDIWEVDPVEACRGMPVLYLHMSPDCTHFSRAKGDVPRSQNIRSLADVGIVWAERVKPLVISLENVPEFPQWGPLAADGRPDKNRQGELFNAWCAKLRALGYVVEHRVLDASLYGAPTKRKRLFLIARRDRLPIVWPVNYGVTLDEIRDVVGHQSTTTTRGYDGTEIPPMIVVPVMLEHPSDPKVVKPGKVAKARGPGAPGANRRRV